MKVTDKQRHFLLHFIIVLCVSLWRSQVVRQQYGGTRSTLTCSPFIRRMNTAGNRSFFQIRTNLIKAKRNKYLNRELFVKGRWLQWRQWFVRAMSSSREGFRGLFLNHWQIECCSGMLEILKRDEWSMAEWCVRWAFQWSIDWWVSCFYVTKWVLSR